MISDKHKTIFVHIPKVAGQSIEHMFLNDLNLGWHQREKLLLRKKKRYENGPYRLAHLKAHEYVEYNYIDTKRYESYFKFSFVRNPFSRAYSYYKYLGYSEIISFKSFATDVLKQKIDKNHFFFIPQTRYLYKDDKLQVDFVGKFENINNDIQVVARKANISSTLPYVNKSKNNAKRGLNKIIRNPKLLLKFSWNNPVFKDYKKAYDKDTLELVKHLYKEDIDKFEYEF